MPGSASELLDQATASLREAGIEIPGVAKLVKTDSLSPNTWNPNRQDDETFAKEKASLRRFGFVSPIIVRGNEIIDGEHRWKAAVELNMPEVPVYDLGPVSDHEAMQLTIVLNELRGKPEPRQLGEVLKRILARDTLDSMTEVLPYTKEQVGQIAQLPEFDWDAFKERNRQAGANRQVERVFRLSAEDNEKLNEALAQAKGDQSISDSEALVAIAGEYIA